MSVRERVERSEHVAGSTSALTKHSQSTQKALTSLMMHIIQALWPLVEPTLLKSAWHCRLKIRAAEALRIRKL